MICEFTGEIVNWRKKISVIQEMFTRGESNAAGSRWQKLCCASQPI